MKKFTHRKSNEHRTIDTFVFVISLFSSSTLHLQHDREKKDVETSRQRRTTE